METKDGRGVRRNTQRVWMHVRGGGAGIPPEPQLTQTQKEHRSVPNMQGSDSALALLHWIQLEHSSKI